MLAPNRAHNSIPQGNRTRPVVCLGLALVAMLGALARPAWCEEPAATTPPTPPPPSKLEMLLKGTGLHYMMEDPATGCLLMRGDNGLQLVVVRLHENRALAYADIVAAKDEDVPTALWRKVAQVNAGPWLSHVGYEDGMFFAGCGVEEIHINAKLLRAMVMEVAGMADELKPVFKDLLTVE